MEQQRDQNRIQHHKKQERINIRKGMPNLSSLSNDLLEIWDIPNYGLYLVIKHNNELHYNKFTTTLS